MNLKACQFFGWLFVLAKYPLAAAVLATVDIVVFRPQTAPNTGFEIETAPTTNYQCIRWWSGFVTKNQILAGHKVRRSLIPHPM